MGEAYRQREQGTPETEGLRSDPMGVLHTEKEPVQPGYSRGAGLGTVGFIGKELKLNSENEGNPWRALVNRVNWF